ncbi:MAG: hypothetical protein ACI9E5_001143, partial [Candidatus Omnitrophota bacterium]
SAAIILFWAPSYIACYNYAFGKKAEPSPKTN